MKKTKILMLLISTLALCSCTNPGNSELNSEVDSSIADSSNNNDASSSTQVHKSEYEEWKESEFAKDYNKDNKIDEKDFIIFNNYKEWRSNDELATDYNKDSKITIEDYILSIEFTKWLISENNYDYNNDSKITIDDYIIYIDFNKWKESDDAIDINDDRVIDYLDYTIFMNQDNNEYLTWKNSVNGKDYNLDGIIDIKDFNHYKLFGNYKMRNYFYSGSLEIGYSDIYFYFRYLDEYLDEINFKFDDSGIKISLSNRLKYKLDTHYQEIVDTLDSAIIDVTSKDAFNIRFETIFDGAPVEFSLYFNKSDVLNLYNTSINVSHNGHDCKIIFDLERYVI